MKDPTPDILRRVERYRDRHRLTDFKVSMIISGSGNLVKRLRDGNVTVRTLKKVSDWLTERASQQKDVA